MKSKILKPSSTTYRLRSYQWAAKCKRAIAAGNDALADMYAGFAACNARRSIAIESRMLRHSRPVIRTIALDGSFQYYRLVNRKAVQL